MTSGTVCLSFDFDAVSLWLARGITAPGPLSRGEFAAVAVPRILDFLAARSLQVTWFIPGHTIETYPALCQEIVAAGHEIGLHGYLHELSVPDPETERSILDRTHRIVSDLQGTAPQGYRAPGGYLSEATIRYLLAFGIRYDSSLKGDDYHPYWLRSGDGITADGPLSFGTPTSIVEVPNAPSLDDFWHFEFNREAQVQGLRPAADVLANWWADIRYLERGAAGGVVVLTLHPEVIGRGHRLLMLEDLVDRARDDGLDFATLAAVAARFRSRQQTGPASRSVRTP